jgi:hypothetical protein
MSEDELTAQDLAEAIISDDLSPMPIEEIKKAWAEMKRLGLTARTGVFRNGHPVYDFTPRGRQHFEAAMAEVARRTGKPH